MKSSDDFLPYGHQSIDESDVNAVVSVMRSDWLTQGPQVQEFEAKLADYCGAKYAVTFSSGTAALHAACFAAGIKRGDTVLTTPITFVATANAPLFLGAKIQFIDVEPETANIDVSLIEERITPKVKAILPVDFAGQPVDLDELRELAIRHHLTIIEDACHSIGASYKTSNVGSCSDLTVFSFHPVKNMTTGEGGAVLTNNSAYHKKLTMFRHHGIDTSVRSPHEADSPWYYEMRFLGRNYRLTDIQCALGISQLKKLDSFVARRREIAKCYNEAFSELFYVDPLLEKADRLSTWHIYVIKLKLEELSKTRKQIFNEFRTRGIGVQVHYIPVYWHPYYQNMGFKRGICPVAERYYERALTLPLFPSMDHADVERVLTAVNEVLG